MYVSKTPAIERIARVLAAQELSDNAGGTETSASAAIDATWPAHREEAISILRTLREPDEAMASAGDPVVWERMVAAALGKDLPGMPSEAIAEDTRSLDPGSDPFVEGP